MARCHGSSGVAGTARSHGMGCQATWEIPHLPVEVGSGNGDPDDQDSWPGARLAYRRDRFGGHETDAGAHGPGWRINKPKGVRCGKS